jgi:hypothetical protein
MNYDIVSSAIKALGTVGTFEAAAKLRAFIEQPVSGPSAIRFGPVNPADDRELQLKIEAITTIASMKSLGGETFHILDNIANNAALSKSIRNAAAKANDDPVGRAEHKLDEADYTQAIAEARRFLESSPNDARAQQARNIVARGYLRLGTGAMDDTDYATATLHLQAALAARGDQSTAEEAVNLGLKLAYYLHEQVAPSRSSAYEDTYKVLTSLQPLSRYSPEGAVSVQSNLAEASLTTGRYDEARRLAESLLQTSRLDAELNLNMRVMLYAATVLSGDAAAESRAREQLWSFYDSVSKNSKLNWSYGGVRSYIRGLDIPLDRKQQLWSVLDKVEMK